MNSADDREGPAHGGLGGGTPSAVTPRPGTDDAERAAGDLPAGPVPPPGPADPERTGESGPAAAGGAAKVAALVAGAAALVELVSRTAHFRPHHDQNRAPQAAH